MAEPKTYAAQLAKRVREALREAAPRTRFKVSGASAWGGRPDRVVVTWEDGPSRRAVERTVHKVVRPRQVTLRRDVSGPVLAELMLEIVAEKKNTWEVARTVDTIDVQDVTPSARAAQLARIVETHLGWYPPQRDGEELGFVTSRARAWRTGKLAVALAGESDAALEVLHSLALERSSDLDWEQYVELAAELSR